MDSYFWENITYLLGLRKLTKNEEYSIGGFEESIFDQFGRNILVSVNKKGFTIDRDMLITSYYEHYKIPMFLCAKFKESPFVKEIQKFEKEATFPIKSEDDLFDANSLLDEKTIEEIKITNEKEQNELIIKIGDEVEKRIRKIFEEYRQ